MEDSSQSSRRTRPESSASSHTRMTPNSSNSSSSHLPRTNSMRDSGTSLLQERLRERKVEAALQGRRRSIDLSSNMGRAVHSSPVKATRDMDSRRQASAGLTNGRSMGVKQIEDQVTTLHKQNFDLKLELYHRRQRQEALEAQLEAAEKKLAEKAELQEINEQLLAELEKRDIAVEEAVCMIVNLEEKVDRLTQDRDNVRAFEADYEPGYFQEHHEGPPSSPPQLQRKHLGVMRMPSFLSETTEGADALRSLYLPSHNSYSDAGLPKLLEDGTTDGMNSPRLSVLSESSFLSVYGDKLQLQEEPVELPRRRHRASSAVEKWVDERPVPIDAPARPSPPIRKTQYLSINDVLESPLQRLEKLKHTLEKSTRELQPPQRTLSVQEKRQSKELRQLFTADMNYVQQQGLPPTPDTVGTNTLRHNQNSNDTLAEGRNGVYLSNTHTLQVPAATLNAFQSTISVRPQSAGETVTSRREGHGWDTPSQDTITETSSADGSIATLSSHRFPRPSRVETPNLFSFTESGWGKDVMYDHELSLPAHTAPRYSSLRRQSMVENPPSDLTIIQHSSPSETIPRYGTTPIDITVQPPFPDRRSSLTAPTKLRKSNATPPVAFTPDLASSPGPVRKMRMPSLRIFGRSETVPITTQSAQSSPMTTRPRFRSVQTSFDASSPSPSPLAPRHYEEDDEGARATPPPIQRNRPSHSSSLSSYRPSSAGQGATNRRLEGAVLADFGGLKRRGSVGVREAVGGGVVGNVKDGEEEVGNGKGGPRKWFGIGGGGGNGRTASLRRT